MIAQDQKKPREEIAIIGGGLSGCLTALMLAKNPKFHVTLIEKKPELLNGASVIASRLHLGGEYPEVDPKDPCFKAHGISQTQYDCIRSAMVWKLLMPSHIYTPTPPMKFLVGSETEMQNQQAGGKPEHKKLTVEKYITAYENMRKHYEKIYNFVKRSLGWSDEVTENKLFGSYKEGEYFHILKPEEYASYEGIAGGLQSQERGINVLKYLAMIEEELGRQQMAGNITILTGHKVVSNGVSGKFNAAGKGFKIACENGSVIEANQVVEAAYRDGPAIIKELTRSGTRSNIEMVVYKRAMLLIKKLPAGWKTPPAFVMMGDDGGMLAPYNDEVAICYRPTNDAAYWFAEHVITPKEPHLPENWDHLSPQDEQDWQESYLASVKKRFPILKDIKLEDTQLIIRDTVAFEKSVRKRPNTQALEARIGTSMQMVPRQEPRAEMLQRLESQQVYNPPEELKIKKGVFTLYPTKATYCVGSALQAASMVDFRSQYPDSKIVVTPDPLHLLLTDDASEQLEKYSLANIPPPSPMAMIKFLREHNLPYNMLKSTWPGQYGVNTDTSWAIKIGSDHDKGASASI
jgi:hypothetical protein